MELGIWFRVRNRLSTCLQGVLLPFFFAEFGRGARILRPLRISGSDNIWIGRDAFINHFAWLETIACFDRKPALRIEHGVYIGNSAHIIATQSIVIEADALIADRVYIADYAHGYQDVRMPVKHQSLTPRAPVKIGTGTWIGENAVVIGCTIGRNCVIGANSVVLTDIPEYCVAVGTPARIIRRWDPQTGQWIKA